MIQDKLQGTKTELLDFQNPSKEKFEEQRKKLESSKTQVEGYTDEKVNLKRQMQEIRASSGTGLINLKNSTRSLELSTYFDNTAKRQEQPHKRTQQSMRNCENNSLKEQQSQQRQSSNISSSTQQQQSNSRYLHCVVVIYCHLKT